MKSPRLTQYSHGAGCGCKLAPSALDVILAESAAPPKDGRLLVGNHSRDDAAAYDLGDGTALISTTDFFMPIVDDPFEFGRIAAANAISDVYAMGGRPVMAVGILAWPIDKLPVEVAAQVVEGGRSMCREAGIALAGGHSVDAPEPVFGLAVSGLVPIEHLKRNDTARPGDLLFLTKPLGIGLLSTAEKKGVLRDEDVGRAAEVMCRLNDVGEALGGIAGVTAMTDVTGFGLLGHLAEMCRGSGTRADIYAERVPTIAELGYYLERGAIPGGTARNWESCSDLVGDIPDAHRQVLCDPQTSGGLLIAARPEARGAVQEALREAGLSDFASPIGLLHEWDKDCAQICVGTHSP